MSNDSFLKNKQLVARALTIAGSDCGGGAGIQADLKTFTAHQVFGTSVITALTAQNTIGVQGIHPVPCDFILQQLNSIADDIGFDAVKTGMLFDAQIIKSIASFFSCSPPLHCNGDDNNATIINNNNNNAYNLKLVVDPVMISTSGNKLLKDDAIESLKTELLPQALIVTPNIPEAKVLIGASYQESIKTIDEMKKVVREVKDSCKSKYVLLKGGHMFDEKCDNSNNELIATDILFDGYSFHEFKSAWVNTKNTHGTGCTLSAAITANLAKGMTVIEAVEAAKLYVTAAIQDGARQKIGKGHGPLNHMPIQWFMKNSQYL